jgi:hypothetical protein
MYRKTIASRWTKTALLTGGAAILIGSMALPTAADAVEFASQQTVTEDEAKSSVPVTLVQRRVRVYGPPIGPPIPPGPVPPFAPVVVPAGPPVVPGPTHVRVRVPYFSGDFYVDGVPPAVVVEEPAAVEPGAGAANRRVDSGVAQNVAYSSNVQYRELVAAYRDLRNQLSTLTTGEKWRTFLQLPLEPVPAQNVLDYLSSGEGQERLKLCLARYDRIEPDATFEVVTGLPAFSRTHEALRSLVDWLSNEPVLAAPPKPLPPPPEEIPLP